MKKYSLIPAIAAAALAAASPSLADRASDKALAITVSEKNADALVQVKATLKIQATLIEGPEAIKAQLSEIPAQEQEVATLAVTVHPSGIIAAPLAQLNPIALTGGEISNDTPLGPIKLSLNASFMSVNVIDSKGVEHPATVVLQDEKEGIALLTLNKLEGDVASISLPEKAFTPEPFEPLIFLSRLGSKFGYEPVIRRGRYVQTLPQPTPFYDLTGMLSDLGTAVFDSKGDFAGISIVPSSSVDSGDAQVVILPPSHIDRLVKKVLARK